jgi:hypothetical protein
MKLEHLKYFIVLSFKNINNIFHLFQIHKYLILHFIVPLFCARIGKIFCALILCNLIILELHFY